MLRIKFVIACETEVFLIFGSILPRSLLNQSGNIWHMSVRDSDLYTTRYILLIFTKISIKRNMHRDLVIHINTFFLTCNCPLTVLNIWLIIKRVVSSLHLPHINMQYCASEKNNVLIFPQIVSYPIVMIFIALIS